MPQLGDTSREVRNAQVVIRMVLRIMVLCLFATLGNVGFGRSLVALLWLSAIMSIAVGAMRRESIFDPTLTHWDEAAAYGAVCCLASILLESWAP